MKLMIEFYAEEHEDRLCNAIIESVIEEIVKENGSIINVIRIPDDAVLIRGNVMCDTPELMAALCHTNRTLEIPAFMKEKRRKSAAG